MWPVNPSGVHVVGTLGAVSSAWSPHIPSPEFSLWIPHLSKLWLISESEAFRNKEKKPGLEIKGIPVSVAQWLMTWTLKPGTLGLYLTAATY